MNPVTLQIEWELLLSKQPPIPPGCPEGLVDVLTQGMHSAFIAGAFSALTVIASSRSAAESMFDVLAEIMRRNASTATQTGAAAMAAEIIRNLKLT